MLRYFVDHSADAVDWLDQNGIKLDNLTITGGMSERGHIVRLMARLLVDT